MWVGILLSRKKSVEDLRQHPVCQGLHQRSTKADIPVKPNAVQGKLAGLSLLVVEDGVDNQRIFRHFLKIAGADFVIVDDGPSALARAFQDDSIDVILTDIQIPDMDGYEITERLRKGGFMRPIIAVTAHSLSTERPLGAKVGMTDFLAKPILIESLIQIILKHARPGPTSVMTGAQAAELVMPASVAPILLTRESKLLSKYHSNPMYQSIIIDFVRSFQQRLETMQALISEMDWEKLGFALHQMKGAAATYGYPQVAEIAAQMEHTAKEAQRNVHAVQAIRQQAESMRGMGMRMQSGLDEIENRTL